MFSKQEKQSQSEQSQKFAGAHSAEAAWEKLDMDMPSVNWEDTPSLEGRLVGSEKFYSDAGDKRVFIVDVGGVNKRLIEQPGLRRLFDNAAVGDEVKIEAAGTRPREGNKEMRLFTVQLKRAPRRSPAQQDVDREMRNERPINVLLRGRAARRALQ